MELRDAASGLGHEHSGFRDQGLWVRVLGLGFRFTDYGLGIGFRVQ